MTKNSNEAVSGIMFFSDMVISRFAIVSSFDIRHSGFGA